MLTRGWSRITPSENFEYDEGVSVAEAPLDLLRAFEVDGACLGTDGNDEVSEEVASEAGKGLWG